MKKLLFIILGLNILPLLFADTIGFGKAPTYTIDDLLRDYPELVPETVMVSARLPKVQLNSEIVNIIMEKHLVAKLKRYEPGGKILLSLGGYPKDGYCIYAFEPVTPIQPIVNIEVVYDSITNIIGYIQYDDIFILLTDYFLSDISQCDTTTHNFKLKLLKKATDERCEWIYLINDSVIRSSSSPEINFEIWKPRVIEMMKRMDEHDF